MPKQYIDAIHDDDLADLLKKLKLYNKFQNGQLTCAFSDDVITWQNLHSIFPDSGAIKFCCSNPDCISNLVSKVRGTQ